MADTTITVRDNGNLRISGSFEIVDAAGNVFLAAGHVYVYSPEGRLIDTIEVPERPVQVVFGGADRRTLFIAARTSLYSVRTRAPGAGLPRPASR